MGFKVAAHVEGLDGTEAAIRHGMDTIEHGMYLNQRPALLESMAPTARCWSRPWAVTTGWRDSVTRSIPRGRPWTIPDAGEHR